jgi:hypothetical protein
MDMTHKTVRYVLLSAIAIAIAVPAVAAGFGEGSFLKLGKRNPSTNSSRALTSETEIIADSSTYGTRQSNKKDGDGGGAIYGCRSATGNEPCLRASNLKGGRAFEFETAGKEAGRFEVKDTTGAPFTTNATGVATGLNADKVDGKDATDLAAASDLAWATVAATDAKLIANRGATEAKLADPVKGTYSVTFSREVKACSFTATPQATTANGNVAFAVSVSTTDPKTVLVDQADDAADRADFSLQVVC